ncbi:hypothetical protein L9F63_003658, partial [Diploptera punctata]
VSICRLRILVQYLLPRSSILQLPQVGHCSISDGLRRFYKQLFKVVSGSDSYVRSDLSQFLWLKRADGTVLR